VTGSIGVIMLTVNAQGLMEKIGVATLAIKSGDKKDAGSPFRALTAEERAMFQSVIDDMQNRFVRLVVESRKLPEARVRDAADGRIYTAEQAGPWAIDRVAYLDEVVAMAGQAAGLREARRHVPPTARLPRDLLRLDAGGGGAEQSLAHLATLVADPARASSISGGHDRGRARPLTRSAARPA
jgi:ClpP class serine protease